MSGHRTQGAEAPSTRRRARRVLGLGLAMMSLAALTTSAATSVSSLTLSSSDLASGGSTTGTVKLSILTKSGTLATGSTTVNLTSSNGTVVSVPSSLDVKNSLGSGSFSVRAGKAPGCATISASVTSTAAKTALVYVEAPSGGSFRLSVDPGAAVGGSPATGKITVTSSTRFPQTLVKLTSNSSLATVPSSVTLPAASPVEGGIYVASVNFGVGTRITGASTCAVITASSGLGSAQALLKIITMSG